MEGNLREQLLSTFEGLVQSVIDWTPRVLVGIVLVLVALIVAKLIEKILRALLLRLRFDDLLQQVGVDQSLGRIGIRESVSRFLPRVVYFLLLFLFARTAADGLGLTAISEALGSFLAYLPNLVAAILILLLGSVAAQFAGRAVARAASESGIDYAASLGGIVSGIILLVLGIMAIGQLEIDTAIVRLVVSGVIAGFALAFGLSFGLGTREITRNVIAGFYARKIFRVGEEIEIRGERGVLRSITPTQTLLEQDSRLVAMSNSVFLEEVVKQ
jgi:hypothetical protein